MTTKLTEQTVANLVAMNPNMPIARAQQKATSLWRGAAFFAVGLACIGFAGWLLVKIVVETKAAPSTPMLLLTALPLAGGIYCLFAGGHIVSGEAMDAAAQTGGVISKTVAKAIGAARGKGT